MRPKKGLHTQAVGDDQATPLGDPQVVVEGAETTPTASVDRNRRVDR